MIEPIDFMVDGHLMTLRQQGKKDCWAVVATMLLSWKLNRDMSVAETMTLAGPQFLQLYLDGQAIDHSQMPSFLGALNLRAEPPIFLSVSGIARLLNNHGPLWMTVDIDPSKNWAAHAKIICGLRGDGSPENTFAWVLDPDKKSPRLESVAQLNQQFNQLAAGDVIFGAHIAQYIHF